jgi:hypothetical protein
VGVGIRLVTTVEAKCFVFHARQELAWILEMGNTGVRSCAGTFGELLKMPFKFKCFHDFESRVGIIGGVG